MTDPHDIAFTRRRIVAGAAATLPLTLAGGLTAANAQQAYPGRPIRCIIPVPAGGTLDLIGRALNQRLQPVIGQPLVLDNKAGAAGQLGVSLAARAPADGYTLLIGNDPPFTIIPALGTPMQFNPESDFAPVSLLMQAYLVLVTTADFPAKNLQELIAYAKANPGKVPYASAGIGSQQHIAMELLCKRAGVEMNHIPYSGIAPAFNSLLAGDTKVMFAALALPLPQIAGGKIKSIALTGPRRNPLLPTTPTLVEQGFADLVISAWFGMFAPAATPADIVKKLQGAVWEIAGSRDWADNVLQKVGFELDTAITPERFATFLRDDRRRWKESIAQIDPKRLAQ